MGLAVTDDHHELAATVRRWAEARGVLSLARAVVDLARDRGAAAAGGESAGPEGGAETWAELAAMGWLGLAVSEESGGQGYGLPELAVVIEELGRWAMPGAMATTAAVATALDRWRGGSADPGSVVDRVRALCDGTALGGVALGAGTVAAASGTGADGTPGRVSGTAAAVLGGAEASVVLVRARVGGDDGPVRWCVVGTGDPGAAVTVRPALDPTRTLADVTLDDVEPVAWLAPGAPVDRLVAVVLGADAVGVAQWCVETASAYATERVQFGRPIGQFQAVKHRCADMLVALEAARAAVWDAARSFGDPDQEGWTIAADAAAALAPAAAFRCARDCIQVLGGIGYTWEHDAHIFLKRATALRHLLPDPAVARAAIAGAVAAGERRSLAVELPEDAAAGAEEIRTRARDFLAGLRDLDKGRWRAAMADGGWICPHWPAPWGLDAGPVEQLVIDEEFAAARVRRPHLQIAGWVLPTLIAHGDDAQRERFMGPSLRGELAWCQMFSEPGAGSDLAALSTRATRVAGGWSITGQKVWTTLAQQAQFAICLARTDPDAPRHEGIGCFLVDMATPGIDIRPLRELTGMAMFNEIFLDDVFVPDDCVVGAPNAGWACARTTLANERVSMASGASFGPGVASLFDLARDRGTLADPLVADRLGALVVDAHAVTMLGVRTTLRALAGGQPGPEASVRKLAAVTHEQAVQETGLALLGADAAMTDGAGAAWSGGFLGNLALSIAGGTSEIQRNVIAERLLGLPKDP